MIKPAQLLLVIASIPVLCVSVAASAQEREVWACQSVRRAGLFWENGKWDATGFTADTLLLTIDGAQSQWKTSDLEMEATCVDNSEFTSCLDRYLGTSHVVLNKEAGIAAYSALYGAVRLPRNGVRDDVSVGSYTCTKF